MTARGPASNGTSRKFALVTPKRPEALAVSPQGELYVVDSTRDQILRRLPNGGFAVMAGTGKRGFSGDGGLAIDAELDLGQFGTRSGVAVASNGTVYFSDTANNRVRAVLKNGDIETVAGGGKQALPTRSGDQVPARSASLGTPVGLAVAPNGDLYIAGSLIVRLTPTGQLDWVAGAPGGQGACRFAPCASFPEGAFDNANALAFDGAGNLLVTGLFPYGGWGIAEVRTTGALAYVGSCRGEGGDPGAVASGPNGSVIAACQSDMFRIAKGAESETEISGATALSPALGVGPRGEFLGGYGIAMGPHGVMYVDTGPNASATPNAILVWRLSGSARLLWKS